MTIILNGKAVEANVAIKGRLVVAGENIYYVLNEDPIGEELLRQTKPFHLSSDQSLSIEDSGGPYSGVTSPVFIDGALVTITLL